jgi:hypothetical protein
MVEGDLAFELKCHTGTLTPGDQSASRVFVLEVSPYYLTEVPMTQILLAQHMLAQKRALRRLGGPNRSDVIKVIRQSCPCA